MNLSELIKKVCNNILLLKMLPPVWISVIRRSTKWRATSNFNENLFIDVSKCKNCQSRTQLLRRSIDNKSLSQ